MKDRQPARLTGNLDAVRIDSAKSRKRKETPIAVRTVVVETQVPEDIFLTLQAYGLFRETLAERSRCLLALRFYQDRTLSLGKAARLAGLSRWEFIELLSENNVPVLDFSDEELADEFAAVDRAEVELRQ